MSYLYNESSESESSDSEEEIFNYSNLGNALINLELKLPDRESYRENTGGKVYKMSGEVAGICLIINNIDFETETLPRRCGSEIDVANLKRVFMRLQFKVTTKKNLRSHEFNGVIEEELENSYHPAYGMFVLVIMSHGGQGGLIYGIDGKALDQHTILKSVYGCEMLKKKPKFIIISACAGDSLPRGSLPTAATAIDFLPSTVDARFSPVNSAYSAHPMDVLLLRSAYEGFVSIRDKDFGSPFVRALVGSLYKHAHHMDLEALCKQVQSKIELYNKKLQKEKREHATEAPIPMCSSTLKTKKLYLFARHCCESRLDILPNRSMADDGGYELVAPLGGLGADCNSPFQQNRRTADDGFGWLPLIADILAAMRLSATYCRRRL